MLLQLLCRVLIKLLKHDLWFSVAGSLRDLHLKVQASDAESDGLIITTTLFLLINIILYHFVEIQWRHLLLVGTRLPCRYLVLVAPGGRSSTGLLEVRAVRDVLGLEGWIAR